MIDEITLLAQIVGGGGGGAVLLYLTFSKILPLLNGKNSHEAPCADLKVTQSQIEEIRKQNDRQWAKMDEQSTTLNEIKGSTTTILSRLP